MRIAQMGAVLPNVAQHSLSHPGAAQAGFFVSATPPRKQAPKARPQQLREKIYRVA